MNVLGQQRIHTNALFIFITYTMYTTNVFAKTHKDIYV